MYTKNGKKIILTNHAKERAEEIGMPENQAMNMLVTAKQEKIWGLRYFNKQILYRKSQFSVKYYKKGKTLFTCKEGKDVCVVITITKK